MSHRRPVPLSLCVAVAPSICCSSVQSRSVDVCVNGRRTMGGAGIGRGDIAGMHSKIHTAGARSVAGHPRALLCSSLSPPPAAQPVQLGQPKQCCSSNRRTSSQRRTCFDARCSCETCARVDWLCCVAAVLLVAFCCSFGLGGCNGGGLGQWQHTSAVLTAHSKQQQLAFFRRLLHY